jgi:hypothetical protein
MELLKYKIKGLAFLICLLLILSITACTRANSNESPHELQTYTDEGQEYSGIKNAYNMQETEQENTDTEVTTYITIQGEQFMMHGDFRKFTVGKGCDIYDVKKLLLLVATKSLTGRL